MNFVNLFAQAESSAADQLSANVQQTTSTVWNSFNLFWQQLIALAPKAFFAIMVLVIGYIVARLVSRVVVMITERIGIQRVAENGGFVQSMNKVGIDRTVPQVIGTIVFWFLMCSFLIAAVDGLGLPALKTAIDKLVGYVPNLLIAAIVFVLGLLLATFLRGIVATSADRVGLSYAQQLATGCYWALALMTCNAALSQLDIHIKLFNEIVLILLGGGVLAFGLSFGLGGRDVMAGILAGYYVRQRLQSGDHVSVCGYEGVVREVGPVATIIETDEAGLLHRHSIPNTKMLNEAVR